MKSTIWANCPKCQTELKIDTEETELVQIECPDCYKVFAAKVPPRSAAPVHEVLSQMPVLPPFQPAQVHYKPRSKSDDSLPPAVLTALIVVCASAILIPLGFGGYYVYGKLSEASQLAIGDSTKSTSSTSSTSQQSSVSTTPSSEPSETVAFGDYSVSTTPSAGASSGVIANSPTANSTEQPQLSTSTQPDTTTFAVPELNPPPLIQSESSSSDSATLAGNLAGTMPDTSTPSPNSSTSTQASSTPFQGQISVSGAGTSKSGLPVPLHRFIGSSGVMIFVLHSKGHSVTSSIQELQRKLSIAELHADGGSDHTTIGIRYSGSVDSVAKDIQFGRVSYVDEESRSIHVQVN